MIVLGKQSTKNRGFTLVEIMIAISITAILVAIALPSYQNSVMKARRSDAQTALLNFAGDAERIYTLSNSYATAALPADTDFYTFSFPVAVTATTFTIRATPTSLQSDDGCGTMNLNHTGQKTRTGSQSDCW